ncbi:MAG: FxLYD domain-containing protein [Thermoanaerobaculia bacterium]
MPRVHRAFLLTAALAGTMAAGFTGGTAHADWLVMRDGARLETRGAWKVDGRKVLFTMPNGTLSVLRADEVDLDQSALVTTRAKEPPVTPAIVLAKKEPVLRLTEKDIPPVGEAAMAAMAAMAAAGKEGEGKAGEGTAESASPLEVISWEKTENGTGDGLEIFGTIKNGGTNIITTPTLLVAIYDADGGLLASVDGEVNSPQIQPGKTANFRVAIPGVPDFASVKFDAQGRGFKPRVENAGVDESEAPEYEEPAGMPATEEAPAEEPPPN